MTSHTPSTPASTRSRKGPAARRRAQRIIERLETLLNEGEKKVDAMIEEKIGPVADAIDRWLTERFEFHTDPPKKKNGRAPARKTKKRVSKNKRDLRARKSRKTRSVHQKNKK